MTAAVRPPGVLFELPDAIKKMSPPPRNRGHRRMSLRERQLANLDYSRAYLSWYRRNLSRALSWYTTDLRTECNNLRRDGVNPRKVQGVFDYNMNDLRRSSQDTLDWLVYDLNKQEQRLRGGC